MEQTCKRTPKGQKGPHLLQLWATRAYRQKLLFSKIDYRQHCQSTGGWGAKSPPVRVDSSPNRTGDKAMGSISFAKEVEAAPPLTIDVEICDENDVWQSAAALVDSGSSLNLIDYSLALKLGLKAIDQSQKPEVSTVSAPSHVYQAYSVTLRSKDTRGYTRTVEHIFYAITFNTKPKVILGAPLLDAHRIATVMGNPRAWYWEFYKFEIMPAKLANDEIEEIFSCSAILVISDVKSPETTAKWVVNSVSSQPTQVQDILNKYKDVLEPTKEALSVPCKDVYHRIETTGDPPYGPIYSLSQRELKALREYLEEATALGYIRHSESPAGAPILLVPKKDGTLRICVDYRGLNKVTTKNRHPLPLIGEILDRLSGAKVYSKLDLTNAYHRIPIHPDDVWKTAFRTRYGHFEYKVMPFGLTNAPATFQAWMNKALAGYLDEFAIAYLDDILIYSNNWEEHRKHLEKVLKRLRQYGLYCNSAKCKFLQTEIDFLGYIITPQGVKMDADRTRTITEWPEPTGYHDVQQFLGFANFYRRFIYGYSGTVAPLTGLLKGSEQGIQTAPWRWPLEARKAFQKIKEAFTKAPLLAHYDPARQCKLETDASIAAIAGILSQKDDNGVWHPVAFYSKKLNETEGRYETHDQELMAIWASFKHWRHYLEGVQEPTLVLSDHQNLSKFMDVLKLNGRQARWAMYLAGFDFEIKHQAGKKNPADAPSRRPDYVAESAARTDSIPLMTLHKKLALLPQDVAKAGKAKDWVTAQVHMISAPTERREAPVTDTSPPQAVPRALAREASREVSPTGEESWMLKQLIQALQKRDPKVQKIRARLEKHAEGSREGPVVDWTLIEGILHHKGRTYVPEEESLRQELLKRYHDDPLAGHSGRDRTRELLQRHYYWPDMAQYVADYVAKCEVCQLTKPRRHRPYGLLQSLPEPQGPWEDITMDFITDLPPSRKGQAVYDSILVIVDRKTTMCLYRPTTKSCDAAELAQILLDSVVSRFGAPKSIVTDRGSVFTSAYWAELCVITRIKRRLSTAFHPQTDGNTERKNQSLIHWLRCFVDEHQTNWASLLPMAEFAHNNRYNESIKTTPFRALYGYDPEVNVNVDHRSFIPDLHNRWKMIESIRQKVSAELQKTQERTREWYNRSRKALELNAGDKVVLSTKNLRTTAKKKLWKRFVGPFEVIEPVGKNAYRLRLPPSWRLHNVFNVEYLEPFMEGHLETVMEPPPGMIANTQDEYEIEEILQSRPIGTGFEFLVKWKNQPTELNEWVPRPTAKRAGDLLDKFEQQMNSTPSTVRIHDEDTPSQTQPEIIAIEDTRTKKGIQHGDTSLFYEKAKETENSRKQEKANRPPLPSQEAPTRSQRYPERKRLPSRKARSSLTMPTWRKTRENQKALTKAKTIPTP